jgi:hypothetical protein
MKTLHLGILFTLLFSGCEDPKFQIKGQALSDISPRACEVFKGQSDIQFTRRRIQALILEIDQTNSEEKARLLVGKLESEIQKLSLILTPELTNGIYEAEYVWNVPHKIDRKLITSSLIPRAFSINGAEMPLSTVILFPTKHGTSVEVKRRVSLLEWCLLRNTVGLLIEGNDEVREKRFWVRATLNSVPTL